MVCELKVALLLQNTCNIHGLSALVTVSALLLLLLMTAGYAYACTHRQVVKTVSRLTDALFMPRSNMVMLH